jgi:large-conductance mechanosensitive channel
MAWTNVVSSLQKKLLMALITWASAGRSQCATTYTPSGQTHSITIASEVEVLNDSINDRMSSVP